LRLANNTELPLYNIGLNHYCPLSFDDRLNPNTGKHLNDARLSDHLDGLNDLNSQVISLFKNSFKACQDGKVMNLPLNIPHIAPGEIS
jgi:hypothetical protein